MQRGQSAPSQAAGQAGHSRPSVPDILVNAPKLSEEDWKVLRLKIITSAPPKRRELVRYLLFRCGRKPVCWPSDEIIGKQIDCCERSVRNYLHELDEVNITRRISVPTRSRRAIFFLEAPGCNEIMTLVKQSGKICRLYPAKTCKTTRQILPEKPLTVTVQPKSSMNGNSRTQDEGPENEQPALEDGGTGGKENLSNGNGNERSLEKKGAWTPGMAPPPCPSCGKQMETMGRGAFIACLRCVIQTTPADLAALLAGESHQAVAEDVPDMPGLEFLARLKKNAPSAVCEQAWAVLCQAFEPTDAHDSSQAYRKVVNRVRRGFLSPAIVVHAFKRAMDPSAVNPGKVFTYNVEHRIQEPVASLKPPKTAGGKS